MRPRAAALVADARTTGTGRDRRTTSEELTLI